MKAWQINEKDFPQNKSDAEKLAFCVRYAGLAPSVYNTQPWFFHVDGKHVHLFADRRHALPVVDPDDRQQNICCGAALFGLRLAIHYFGYKETTELLPDPENPDLLARVKLGDTRDVVEDDVKTMFSALPERHMNRGSFSGREVPEDVLRKLQAEASKEGAWFHVCSPIEKKLLVRMVAEADHIQAGNKHFRRELASWIDQSRWKSGDGMPNLGLSHADIMGNFSPSVARRFAVDNNAPANDEQLEQNSSVFAVVGGASGGVLERLVTGQALMRLLLWAEAEGLAVSTLNQPCEVPELRLRMHDELDHPGRAQMILRLGYGGKPSYTPRRDLSAILETGKMEPKKAGNANEKAQKSGFLGRMKSVFTK